MKDARNGTPLAETLLSAVGIILVFWALGGEPAQPVPQDSYQFAAFIAICALGAFATLFPRRCSPEIPRSRDLHPAGYTEFLGARINHGHHKDCEEFINHEILIGGKRVCAGCLGLLAGSILAVAITSHQFVQGYAVGPLSGYLGLAFVVSGLAYSILAPGSPSGFRTLLNALLVTGFALVYLSISSARGLGLLGISFSVFWMFTRIRISRWSHDRPCAGCEEPCIDKMGGD